MHAKKLPMELETKREIYSHEKGELLPIITYPSPILKKVAKPVKVFDETIKTGSTSKADPDDSNNR